jgi:hypothetical protein
MKPPSNIPTAVLSAASKASTAATQDDIRGKLARARERSAVDETEDLLVDLTSGTYFDFGYGSKVCVPSEEEGCGPLAIAWRQK